VLFTYKELIDCIAEGNDRMKIPCLTLHAQWAAAIFLLGKDIENRTWSTPYRGPLAISAGRNIDRQICKELGLDPDKVVRRHILGTVELVEIVTNSRSRWAMPGHFHWVLANPKPFAHPRTHSGKQGLHPVEVK
jgi:hypothetical protein